MTDIQKITLQDILTTAGLSKRQVEDIFLLLRFKPERVQLAFYYIACGNTFEEISCFLDVHRTTVARDLATCEDIKKYLLDSA